MTFSSTLNAMESVIVSLCIPRETSSNKTLGSKVLLFEVCRLKGKNQRLRKTCGTACFSVLQQNYLGAQLQFLHIYFLLKPPL